MANFPKHHGIELAGNAYIVNHSIEELAADPVPDNAGRSWFNTTEKVFKMSTLSDLGAIIVKTFMTEEEYNAYVTSIASTTTGEGSALVGYSGHAGTNGNYAVAAGDTETALDSIVQRIDQDRTDLDTLVTDIVTPLQNEMDAVEAATGLNADGSLPAQSGNYTTGDTTVLAAVSSLDTQAKQNADDIVTEESARIAADALKISKAGDSMSGNLSMGGTQTVTGLRDPIADQDAATKIYVDTAVQGIDWKESARLVSFANVDIATGGLVVVDSVTTVAGDRVLLVAQTDASENGVYEASATAWIRVLDMDGNPDGEVSNGNAVFVEEGTVYAANGYVITSADPHTVDTTPITFTQFSGAGQIIAGAGISKSGNELFLNFGAGIAELPNDEVGVEVYATGGLHTTTDGSTASTAAGATLAINLDADSKMVLSSTGLKVDPAFVTALTNADTALQNELDATQASAGQNADGSIPVLTGTNYLVTDTTLFDAITTLDGQAKTNADAVVAEASARTNADSAINTEISLIETAAGLNADGTYTADVSTNYIDTASGLKNADKLLDAQIAINTTAVAGIKTNYNASIYRYEATVAQSSYSITHNLGTQNIDATVWVKDTTTGLFHNDIVAVTVNDANQLTIDLTEAKIVRIVVKSFEDLA